MDFSGIADEASPDVAEQIRAHRELGWKYIELRTTGDRCVTDVDDETFDRILEQVTDAGLRISCFAAQIGNWSRPITGDFELDRSELARAIPRMQKAGARFIRFMTWLPGDASPEAWKAEALRRVGELARMAEDGGVMLVHENCTGWASESPENTLEMLDVVGSPALGLIYDTANPLSHGKDTRSFLRALGGIAHYVHIKDWKLDADGSGHGVWPGEGDSLVREQLTAILGAGYDGFVSIEPHVAAVIHEGKKAGDPEAAFRSYVEYGRRAKKLVDEVRAAL